MNKTKFKMPACQNLKNRSSTINNAYATSITPLVRPNDKDEIDQYYKELGVKENQCVYCLKEGNGVDHLKPLVKDGMPSGYITDIHNLVPCCSRCNSSKGSKSFKDWYKSDNNAKRLKDLGLDDNAINERYKKISDYENKIPGPIDYEKIVGKEKWDEYKKRKSDLIKQLEDDQKFLDELNKKIMSKKDKWYK